LLLDRHRQVRACGFDLCRIALLNRRWSAEHFDDGRQLVEPLGSPRTDTRQDVGESGFWIHVADQAMHLCGTVVTEVGAAKQRLKRCHLRLVPHR
jgi:hypothetical protein